MKKMIVRYVCNMIYNFVSFLKKKRSCKFHVYMYLCKQENIIQFFKILCPINNNHQQKQRKSVDCTENNIYNRRKLIYITTFFTGNNPQENSA